MTRAHITAATIAAALALVGGAAAAAPADSTPIGPLPDGPVSTVTAERGTLVAVALPPLRQGSGLVWRVARRLDSRVVRQVSEGEIGTSVVLVFRTVGIGRASVFFAATRGESSSKAVRSVTYRVRVT
jgi:hypothetical protein